MPNNPTPREPLRCVLCRDVIIPGASNTIRAAEHDYHTECLLEAYAAIQRGFAKRKEQPDG